MSQNDWISCPICNGLKKMSIIEITGYGKQSVKIPCTACGGSGKVLFIDNTKTSEPEHKGQDLLPKSVSDGWRKHKKWGNVHYIIDNRPLCRIIKSQLYVVQSESVDDPDPLIMCPTCSKRIEESTSD